MKHWTVQKKIIVNKIKKEGVYYPEFSKSDYIKAFGDNTPLYSFVLDSFNRINSTSYSGLIFSFSNSSLENSWDFDVFDEFKEFIKCKSSIIGPLWTDLINKDCVILELNYDEKINSIPIDINDFQYLMSPFIRIPEYNALDTELLIDSIRNGEYNISKMPSGIIQKHLPYISKENIINIHPMFNLD